MCDLYLFLLPDCVVCFSMTRNYLLMIHLDQCFHSCHQTEAIPKGRSSIVVVMTFLKHLPCKSSPKKKGDHSKLSHVKAYSHFFFKKNFGGHESFFAGPLIPLFWTSGDVFPGFQSQGGSLASVLCRMCAMNS